MNLGSLLTKLRLVEQRHRPPPPAPDGAFSFEQLAKLIGQLPGGEAEYIATTRRIAQQIEGLQPDAIRGPDEQKRRAREAIEEKRANLPTWTDGEKAARRDALLAIWKVRDEVRALWRSVGLRYTYLAGLRERGALDAETVKELDGLGFQRGVIERALAIIAKCPNELKSLVPERLAVTLSQLENGLSWAGRRPEMTASPDAEKLLTDAAKQLGERHARLAHLVLSGSWDELKKL